MKTIKFRVLDKENKMMISSFEAYNRQVCSWRNDTAGNCITLGNRWLDVMQFTGLTDKNGTEIFEGDVVQVSIESYRAFLSVGEHGDEEIKELKPYYVINWDEGSLAFMAKKLGDYEYERGIFMTIACRDDKGLEVIGNIYENPDLLTN